jgi:hypothetical protein
MSDIFSIKRFVLLLRKTITERPTQTVGVTGLLLILSLTLYFVAKNILGFHAAQHLTFAWGFAGGGFFLSSYVFNYFASNASGSSYLTLPASYFEKWLCGVLIAGVFFPIIFLLFYHLMDVFFVAAYHRSLDPNSLFYKQQYDSVFVFDLHGILACKVYFMFAMLTGFMLTGGLYFNKTALVKTTIAICLILGVLLGLNWIAGVMFFGPIKDAGIYDHVTLEIGRAEGVILLPSGVTHILRTSIAYLLPAVLWLSPLIRLREKEF